MPNPYVLQKFKIVSPYALGNPNLPSYQQRIQEVYELGQINMIVIDGKAQVGKSTFAENLCKEYDVNHELNMLFTIEEWLEFLEKAKELYDAGKWQERKWVLFEEPQLEAPRQAFWSQRNSIINSITSSFGFLKCHLVMTLPSVSGIQEITLTNISMRITIKPRLKNHQVIRRAYIKLPYYNEKMNRWRWGTPTEIFTIPDLEHHEGYMKKKANNFFNIQLKKWQEKIKKPEEIVNPYIPKIQAEELIEIKRKNPYLA